MVESTRSGHCMDRRTERWLVESQMRAPLTRSCAVHVSTSVMRREGRYQALSFVQIHSCRASRRSTFPSGRGGRDVLARSNAAECPCAVEAEGLSYDQVFRVRCRTETIATNILLSPWCLCRLPIVGSHTSSVHIVRRLLKT